jgi:signal peptidase I
MLQLNFDDPGVAVALLAIIVGLRLAVYVAERVQRNHPAVTVAPVLSPDDAAEACQMPIALPTPSLQSGKVESGFYRVATELLDAAIIAVILVFCIVRPFVMQAFFIPSDSMVPTLRTGDKLLATKYTFALREPRMGDIVVFHAPRIALELLEWQKDSRFPPHISPDPIDYVKRVIGVPGDRIRIEDHVGVFINGHLLNEPYVADTPNYNMPTDASGSLLLPYGYERYPGIDRYFKPFVQGQELVVPAGDVFVMGDNRRYSHDSHYWGFLPEKSIVGKVSFIFWPPDRIGFVH